MNSYTDSPSAVRQGPPSPIMTASNTFDRSVELAKRVCSLAERLCGDSMSTDGSGKSPTSPARPGLFGALEVTCINTNAELEMAFIALARIENELP